MKRETRIGITLFAGILATYLFVAWLKKIHIFSVALNHYEIRFNDVSGLKVGDPVMVRGVSAGNVDRIAVNQNEVLVTIGLGPEIQLTKNATAEIRMKELMGGKNIIIQPGKGPALGKDTLNGTLALDFPSSFSNVGNLIEGIPSFYADSLARNINQIANALNRVVTKFDSEFMNTNWGLTASTLEKLNQTLSNALQSGQDKSLASAIQNWNSLAPLLEKFFSNSEKLEDKYLAKLDSFLPKVEAGLVTSNQSLIRINALLDGPLGKWLNDPQAGRNLEETLLKLNQTLDKINEDQLTIGLKIK